MPAVMSRGKTSSRAGRLSSTKVVEACPEFSEAEYKKFLKNRSKLSNHVARENPNTSIFDSMTGIEGEFKKKIYGGMSLNDMFKNLR